MTPRPTDPAPYLTDMPGTQPAGEAFWLRSADGLRIRVAVWRPAQARGTVLLLPGRTEYIEKYAATAHSLHERGLATLVIDWRGQGLSGRLLPERRLGHVERFADYQHDLAAALLFAHEQHLPLPWHMLAHSMGGAIGLRALMDGLAVQSCAFTGPMWGIAMPAMVHAFACGLTRIASLAGLDHRRVPGTALPPYVERHAFAGNTLTSDPEIYAMLRAHVATHPELGIGGPSLRWLREALCECRGLRARPSPRIPCLVFCGEDERIIDRAAVSERMQRWPGGALEVMEGGRHELLVERPQIRTPLLDRLTALFSGTPAP